MVLPKQIFGLGQLYYFSPEEYASALKQSL